MTLAEYRKALRDAFLAGAADAGLDTPSYMVDAGGSYAASWEVDERVVVLVDGASVSCLVRDDAGWLNLVVRMGCSRAEVSVAGAWLKTGKWPKVAEVREQDVPFTIRGRITAAEGCVLLIVCGECGKSHEQKGAEAMWVFGAMCSWFENHLEEGCRRR